MSKKIVFTKEQIHNKAYELFKTNGLNKITARELAKALQCSSAPIYASYLSMDVLKNELIERAKDSFLFYIKNNETEMALLNIGLGICKFAREEKQLFTTIFLRDVSYKDLISEFHDIVKTEIYKDERFIKVDDELKETLLLDCWIYAHGLSTLIVNNYFQNPCDEFLKKRLLVAPTTWVYKAFSVK